MMICNKKSFQPKLSMNSGFETNIEDVFEQFKQLTAQGMEKAVKSAIGAGAAALRKQTIANLNSSIASHRTSTPFNDQLSDGVLNMKTKGAYGDDLVGGVHIMGTRKKGSGTYRLRFLEMGTTDRYATTVNGNDLKKQRFTGHVTGTHFFKNATDSIYSNLEQIFATAIGKAVEKINNTKI